jgi:hypothetical protein
MLWILDGVLVPGERSLDIDSVSFIGSENDRRGSHVHCPEQKHDAFDRRKNAILFIFIISKYGNDTRTCSSSNALLCLSCVSDDGNCGKEFQIQRCVWRVTESAVTT